MKICLHKCIPFLININKNCISGVMINMLISGVMISLLISGVIINMLISGVMINMLISGVMISMLISGVMINMLISGVMISMLISGVMISMLILSGVDHGFEPPSGQTKTLKLLHFAMQVALRSKSKDLLSWNQDNVS